MKQKHYSVFFLGLLFISAVQAQMMVKNSADGEVMRITQDGIISIMTQDASGRVNLDKPGNVFSFPGNFGLNTGVIGYYSRYDQVGNFQNYNQYIGMGAWIRAGAPSNPPSGRTLVDTPIRGTLYLDLDGTQKSVATGYLGVNRVYSSGGSIRELSGLYAHVDNIDAAFNRFSDLRYVSAISGIVNRDQMGNHPNKIWSGYFGGAPSIFTDGVVVTSGGVNFGLINTEGTWRIIISGSNLVFQRYESGNWVSKHTITP